MREGNEERRLFFFCFSRTKANDLCNKTKMKFADYSGFLRVKVKWSVKLISVKDLKILVKVF